MISKVQDLVQKSLQSSNRMSKKLGNTEVQKSEFQILVNLGHFLFIFNCQANFKIQWHIHRAIIMKKSSYYDWVQLLSPRHEITTHGTAFWCSE